MIAIKVIVAFAASWSFALGAPSVYLHPDAGLNVLELIEKHGYNYERHEVVTEDGYILEMHRIPHGKNNLVPDQGAVLLMHGLTSSSADWVNIGPGRSLAYLLADLGYDVWIGNVRGNEWGRKHQILNPDVDKAAFFDYSYHEHGVYDVPAKIDYILNATNSTQIQYVGFSQGTTSFFVMAAERPEYNDKISLMTALAPVAYSKNMPNPFLRLLAQYEQSLKWIAKFIGMHEFLPRSTLLELIGKKACDDGVATQAICANIIFLITGYDSEQLNNTFIPVIVSNTPSGSSTKEFLHYAQGIKYGHFRKYDNLDAKKNLQLYNDEIPPDYDIKKITTPIALYYAPNDWLASVTDVERLRDELPNVVSAKLIQFEKFNHLDFIFANDVVDLVYNDVLEEMLKY